MLTTSRIFVAFAALLHEFVAECFSSDQLPHIRKNGRTGCSSIQHIRTEPSHDIWLQKNFAPIANGINENLFHITRGSGRYIHLMCSADSASDERYVIEGRHIVTLSLLTAAIALAFANMDVSSAATIDESQNICSIVLSKSLVSSQEILEKAAKRALGGGKAGASAAVIQICSLMWLRTAMNYQYRYGGTLFSSLKTLYEEDGINRLYQGLPFALIQGPFTRFGDTAANVGVLALLESIPETSTLPLPIKTFSGSICAGLWRIFLMPIDTSKTTMQVEGSKGLARLKHRVIENGPSPLYQGSIASAAATATGHFPWFLTYNFCNEKLFPDVSKEDDLLLFLVRNALLGLAASCISDCVSNSLRIVKVYKQSTEELSYLKIVQNITEESGLSGLFLRGLKTRILTNALQGALFSVLWKYFQETQT